MIKVNALGTEYSVYSEKEHYLPDDMDGFCDETTGTIVVRSYEEFKDDSESKENLEIQRMKVLRHEIIHAFLFESGLAENSPWAKNEEAVDWFAIQFPKLVKAFQRVGAL